MAIDIKFDILNIINNHGILDEIKNFQGLLDLV